ncbi:MAG: leucyl aminopeptidase family protein [Pseudomonadota bacterium]
MPLTFADQDAVSRPLTALKSSELDGWVSAQPPEVARWVGETGFKADAGTVCLLPGADGGVAGALAGLGTAKDRRRKRFVLASAAARLPEGAWRLDADLPSDDLEEAALGWLLSAYKFRRYRSGKGSTGSAQLVAPEGVNAPRIEAIAAAEAGARDLINTPAEDMGPGELEAAVRSMAKEFGGRVGVTTGDALLAANLPLIHTVGRAADRAPRLIDMVWGKSGPTLTLIGKGVCFDTGGLNLKPGGSMGLMKKDMGGAANVLGLAHAIMRTELDVRLRVLVPAVENAVAGNAFRPGDIYTARNGKTVEINNTDAEGRLVLADALAMAAEEEPDLIVSMATLTGAARVAVGPDLAPFYTDDDALAQALASSADRVRDPVWRLPFWDPYEDMIEPGIADLDNAPSGGMAGSITAALFLRRFAGKGRYLHFDVYGWQPRPAPARPKGGVGQGYRALFDALPEVLGG